MFRNDFMKWHASFIVPYALTYTVGLFRSRNVLAYKLHPLLGIATLVLPLVTYLLLPNKKLIRMMIKNNFNLRGDWVMKVAKIATQVIVVYFLISALSGILLNYGLYGTAGIYQVMSSVHHVSKILVPIAVLTHVAARIYQKKKPVGKTT